ncbi:hypothetical protein [Lonsdalea quercina]|uniref:hypothetical protein n=1 Tax=Lonsdalea quercina TaxID=71657 RepID=UPI00397577B3
MTKKDNLLKKIGKIINELDEVINYKNDSIKDFSSVEQMRLFKKTFLSIVDEIENGQIPPKNERNIGIARVVIDQWPFDFYLGEWLIEAEEIYKEI